MQVRKIKTAHVHSSHPAVSLRHATASRGATMMNPRPDRQRSRSQVGETRRSWLRRRRRLPHRPGLEALERRVVLSPTIYMVDSTGNGTTGSGTSGTLPYVISQANADTNPDGSEIEFDSTVFSTPQTIQLAGTLSLDGGAGPLAIDGPGAGLLAIIGPHDDYTLSAGGTANISGLTITGGGILFGRFGEIGGGIFNGGILASLHRLHGQRQCGCRRRRDRQRRPVDDHRLHDLRQLRCARRGGAQRRGPGCRDDDHR